MRYYQRKVDTKNHEGGNVHNVYKKRKLTLKERWRRWIAGPRFIIMCPEFTRKNPSKVHQELGLRRPNE